MQGRHSALHIALDDSTRATLQGWLRKQTSLPSPNGRAILLLADGQTFAATARHVELRERHVRKWVLRFVAYGLDGLYDKTPRPSAGFFPRWWRCRWSSWPASVLTWSGGPCRNGIARNWLGSWSATASWGHLAADGPADSAAPAAETLAPSSVAVAPGPGMRRSRRRSRRLWPVYPPLGRMGNGVVCGRETSLQPRTRKPHLGRTTGPTRPGRTRVHAQGSPEPLCRV